MTVPSPDRQIDLSHRSIEDISTILFYSELTWDEHQRERYRKELREAIRRLASIPNLGRSRDELAPGLRSYPVKAHVVFYEVRADTLFVVRILHSRQDVREVIWDEGTKGAS